MKAQNKSENAIICFFGMDGSGKSTISEFLTKELSAKNCNVERVWWFESENSLIRQFMRLLGKKIWINSQISPKSARNSKNSILKRILTFIYINSLFLDYLRYGIANVSLSHLLRHDKVTVLDRSMYDVALSISEEFYNGKLSKGSELFLKLSPDPGLIFIIDIPPDIAYSRKVGELNSLDNAKRIFSIHKNFSIYISKISNAKIVHVDNSGNLNNSQDYVLEIASEWLKNQCHINI